MLNVFQKDMSTALLGLINVKTVLEIWLIINELKVQVCARKTAMVLHQKHRL